MNNLKIDIERMTAIGLCLLLFLGGCGGSNNLSAFNGVVANSEPTDESPGGPTTPPVATQGDQLLLRFDLANVNPQVLARLPDEAVSLRLEVFSQEGQPLSARTIPATPTFLLQELPSGLLLIRLTAFDSQGTSIGYFDKRAEAGPGAEVVFDILLAGAQPAPVFGSLSGGTPVGVGFLLHPLSTADGDLAPVRVAVFDARGERLSNVDGEVVLQLFGPATLLGTTSVEFRTGVAEFSDLRISGEAAELRLVAAFSGVPSTTSLPFSANSTLTRRCLAGFPFDATSLEIEPDEEMASGDIDGDGDIDAVALDDDGRYSVLLNDGSGAFTALSPVTTSVDFRGAALAKLNNDAFPELIILSDTSDQQVLVLEGLGEGLFGAPTAYPGQSGAHTLEVTDVNGDGWPDLVASFGNSSSVLAYVNDQTGNFPTSVVTTTSSGPNVVRAGFIDADDVIDLVVRTNLNGQYNILLGNGDGTFTVASATITDSARFTLADMNGDDFADIITVDTDIVQVYSGDGIGGFSQTTAIEFPSKFRDVQVLDLNGDDIVDILVGGGDSNGALSLIDDGSGNYVQQSVAIIGTDTDRLIAEDFDGDGAPDILATGEPINAAYLVLNDGTGNFSGPQVETEPGSPNRSSLADIDGDGDLDSLVAVSDGYVTYFQNLGNGRFSRAGQLNVGTRPQDLALGDLDGDGFLDLVVAVGGDNGIRVFSGRSRGFDFLAPTFYPTGRFPRSVALLDVDGDLDQDVVVGTSSTTETIDVYFNQGGRVLGGRVSTALGVATNGLRPARFNSDQYGDILVAGFSDIYALTGDGAGGFTERLRFSSGDVEDAGSLDRNGDGLDDLFVLEDSQVIEFENSGTASFTEMATVALPTDGAERLSFGDVDGDHVNDLVITFDSSSTSYLAVLPGLTDGGFASAIRLPIPLGGEDLDVADLDRDGDDDFVVVSNDADLVSFFLSSCLEE